MQSSLTVGRVYTDHRKGLLLAAFGGLAFTFDVPLIRLANSDGWTVMYMRGLMMFAVLYAHWCYMRLVRGARLPFVNGIEGLVASLLFVAANFLFIYAVHNTYAANVVFMMALSPLIAAFLSRVFLSEPVDLRTCIAASVAGCGVILIVSESVHHGNWLGDIAAFGVSFVMACSLIWMRRSGKDMTYAPGLGSLMAAIIAFWFATPASLNMDQVVFLGLNGLVAMPLSFALLAAATRFIRAPEIALFMFLETILTPVWIWLFIGEMPSMRTVAGGFIVMCALVAHTLWIFQKSRRIPPPLPINK